MENVSHRVVQSFRSPSSFPYSPSNTKSPNLHFLGIFFRFIKAKNQQIRITRHPSLWCFPFERTLNGARFEVLWISFSMLVKMEETWVAMVRRFMTQVLDRIDTIQRNWPMPDLLTQSTVKLRLKKDAKWSHYWHIEMEECVLASRNLSCALANHRVMELKDLLSACAIYPWKTVAFLRCNCCGLTVKRPRERLSYIFK